MKSSELPDPRIVELRWWPTSLRNAVSRVKWVEENAAAFAWSVLEECGKRDISCLSLDVFDTLLLRGREAEAYRFMAMAERAVKLYDDACSEEALTTVGDIQVTPSVMDAFFAREQATFMSYRTREKRKGCREGWIVDIHREQARMLGWELERGQQVLRQAELDVETALLFPNHALEMVCQGMREMGGKVIAISDMYLDAEFITQLIATKFPNGLPVDVVFSSGDRVVSKRSGLLFDEVAEELELDPTKCLHMGDSLESDVRIPLLKKWNAMHFCIATAEEDARLESLAELTQKMAALGHDVRPFAKV